MSRREKRTCRAAGFTRAQRRAFRVAWNTDVADLSCYQARLIMAYYFAAGCDPDDFVSRGLLEAAAIQAEILEVP